VRESGLGKELPFGVRCRAKYRTLHSANKIRAGYITITSKAGLCSKHITA